MGTGQKVAIAGMVVLIGAVVAYYALQEPVDTGEAGGVALDRSAELPPPTPADAPEPTAGDPSMTPAPPDQRDVDLTGIEHLLNLSEPSKPKASPRARATEQEPIDTLTQTTDPDAIDVTAATGPSGENELVQRNPSLEPREPDEVDETDPDTGVTMIDAPPTDRPRMLTDSERSRAEPADSTVRIDTAVTEGDAAEDDDGDLERYTVVEGDSMWIIARKTLGSGAKWQLIAKANPLIDPLKIKPGDELIIPQVEPERGPIAEKTPRDPLGLGFNQDEKVIEVLEGDSLWKIAAREYGDGTKWRIIYTANQTRMKHESDIRPGQQLLIPPLPRD